MAAAALVYAHATCLLCGTMTMAPQRRPASTTYPPARARPSPPPARTTEHDALLAAVLSLGDADADELEAQLALGELDELAVRIMRQAGGDVAPGAAAAAAAGDAPRLQTDREARAAERARRREEQHAQDMKKQAAARKAEQYAQLKSHASAEWEKLRWRAEKLARATAAKKGIAVQEGQSAIAALEDARNRKRHRLELVKRRREEEKLIEEREIAADLAGAAADEGAGEDEWLKAARLNGGA